MIKGNTTTGFEFEIAENVLADDYEAFEIACEVQEGNAFVFPKLGKLLLGNEQYNALKDHCRDENGKVPTAKLMEEISEILTANNKLKN